MKRPAQLPVVLNRDEVAKILKVTSFLKHKALLTTAYSAGLRVGEVVRLKVSDVDSKRTGDFSYVTSFVRDTSSRRWG